MSLWRPVLDANTLNKLIRFGGGAGRPDGGVREEDAVKVTCHPLYIHDSARRP